MTELQRIKQYRIDAENFAEAFAEQLDFIPIIVVPPIPKIGPKLVSIDRGGFFVVATIDDSL